MVKWEEGYSRGPLPLESSLSFDALLGGEHGRGMGWDHANYGTLEHWVSGTWLGVCIDGVGLLFILLIGRRAWLWGWYILDTRLALVYFWLMGQLGRFGIWRAFSHTGVLRSRAC